MALEINDLPQLQDLTPEQLKELFGGGRFQPQLEALEDRIVQSGFSVLSAATTTSASSVARRRADAKTPSGSQSKRGSSPTNAGVFLAVTAALSRSV